MKDRVLASLLCGAAFLLPFQAQVVAQDNFPESAFDQQISQSKSSMMSDPAAALSFARKAAASAQTMPADEKPVSLATSQWLEGEALTRLNKAKDADPVVLEALATVTKSSPNSKLHADLLKSRAAIVGQIGKVENALNILHRAYGIYEKLGEKRSQAIILHNIATIYYEARDYPRVLKYYDQAETVYPDDPVLNLSSRNNLGNTYRDMGNFAAAEKEFQVALEIAREMKSPLLQARILNNLAFSQYAQGSLTKADKTAIRGIAIADATASEWKPFLWGTRAQIALEQGKLSTAMKFIGRTFHNVDLNSSQMEFRDHHATAHQIYKRLDQPDKALAHFEAFKRLDDNGRNLAASTNSSLLAAQFDETNRELRISKLEAKQAQREVALSKSQTTLRYVILMLIFTLVVIGGLFIGITSIRRQRKKVSAVNAQLSHAAKHDLLTGLANRNYYRDLVTEGLAKADTDGKKCAVMLIDLDRFKTVNDTLGHEIGDKLLRRVADQLNSAGGDNVSAVRLGGDEFALVVPDIDPSLDVGAFGEAVIEKLSQPHLIDGVSVEIGATIGVAIGPDDGNSVSVLTRRADLALYRGKNSGRGRCVGYKEYMQIEADERHLLEADLRGAMEKGELSIAYQSIVSAESQETVAYEALLRWDHPTRGKISPDVFIPIAEDARLISQIGSWVLRTTCAEAKTWPENIRLSVNVSALQIEGGGLANSIVGALAASGLNPEQLELEVTETVFLNKDIKTEETLDGLRSLGIQLVLDDFGTGYSSLGYLQRANFSSIKIDRSFVKSATQGSAESMAIIRAIVSMAQELGMQTTAEGIETEQDMIRMRDLGCSQLQGYHFSRPSTSVSSSEPDTPSTSTIVSLKNNVASTALKRKAG